MLITSVVELNLNAYNGDDWFLLELFHLEILVYLLNVLLFQKLYHFIFRMCSNFECQLLIK